MPLSYNQLLELNQQFATAHPKLNNFGNGADFDLVLHDQENPYRYPIMWMVDLPNPVQTGIESFSWEVYFLAPVEQLENKDGDFMLVNYNEVKSDMKKVALDLLAYWSQDHEYNLRLEKNLSIELIDYWTPDDLSGARMTLTLSQPFNFNKCAVPLGTITPLPPSCAPVLIFENGILVETVASGGTYSYTSGGGVSLDIDVNGVPFYVGVSIDQDVPVKKSDATTNVGSKIGANWIIGDSNISNSNDTFSVDVLAENNYELADQSIEVFVDLVSQGVTTYPAMTNPTINIIWT